jgi:hypothetical protein
VLTTLGELIVTVDVGVCHTIADIVASHSEADGDAIAAEAGRLPVFPYRSGIACLATRGCNSSSWNGVAVVKGIRSRRLPIRCRVIVVDIWRTIIDAIAGRLCPMY